MARGRNICVLPRAVFFGARRAVPPSPARGRRPDGESGASDSRRTRGSGNLLDAEGWMGRRRRVGVVAVVAAITLTFVIVKVVRRDLLRSTTRPRTIATLGSPASGNPATSRSE